jgi:hypothetical protein
MAIGAERVVTDLFRASRNPLQRQSVEKQTWKSTLRECVAAECPHSQVTVGNFSRNWTKFMTYWIT